MIWFTTLSTYQNNRGTLFWSSPFLLSPHQLPRHLRQQEGKDEQGEGKKSSFRPLMTCPTWYFPAIPLARTWSHGHMVMWSWQLKGKLGPGVLFLNHRVALGEFWSWERRWTRYWGASNSPCSVACPESLSSGGSAHCLRADQVTPARPPGTSFFHFAVKLSSQWRPFHRLAAPSRLALGVPPPASPEWKWSLAISSCPPFPPGSINILGR